MALRPDGRALVVGDEHGNVSFLDPVTRRRLRPPYRPQPSYIRQLVFSPDGSRLAVGGVGMIQLLDGRTFRRAGRAPGPRRDIQFINVAFSPDGRVLVAMYESAHGRPEPAVASCCVSTGARAGASAARSRSPSRLAGRRRRVRPGRALAADRRARPAVLPRRRRATGLPRDARSWCAIRGRCGPCAASPGCRSGRPLPRRTHLRRRRRRRLRALPGPAHGAAAHGVGTARGRRQQRAVHARRALADHRRRRRESDRLERPGAAAVETLEGHAGPMVGAAVDRRGRTLYTAAGDGTVITWDLLAIAGSAAPSTRQRRPATGSWRRRSAATAARSPCSRPTARSAWSTSRR